MTGLRDYQQKLLGQAVDTLIPSGARVILQLPTGGGKTHIAGALLRRWMYNGHKAVWLTHRTELAEQTRQMLAEAGVPAVNPTWRPGNDAPFISKGVVILMAQTVGRRTNQMQIWGKYKSADLLLMDEAHHATADGWERAINQWPGRVLGLTATPWRLSKTEGFDHLFKKLLHGPQINELQDAGWLCQARVFMPRPEEVIRGGPINATGEYFESGIEQTNRDCPDVMTAGALRFWQSHAAKRQTIVYAISQDHANNLTALFNEAGIPAAAMLSSTLSQKRAQAIESFSNGTLRVLVNVAVATEGFDLPDASCVVITRPTMSLALYLQMVGRGLRPKADGENCLILDLAGNAEFHGLPEEYRLWSLCPRGSSPGGDAPVVRCEKCEGVSPAASHFCAFCQTPFGQSCPRCGAWRAWERWRYENHCGGRHEPVCDLCHLDAHIQAQLPVTGQLRELDESDNLGDEYMDTEPGTELDVALRDLLEEERRRASSDDEERKNELRSLIASRESELTSDHLLRMFKNHVAALPEDTRPRSELEEYRLFPDWEDSLKQEVASWKEELNKLESKVPDRRVIYNNARERVLQVLEAQALQVGLLPHTTPRRETPMRRPLVRNSGPAPADISGWVSLTIIEEQSRSNVTKLSSFKPQSVRDPQGKEISVANWSDLLFVIAEWLMEKGTLTIDKCPLTVGNMGKRYLIHSSPWHPTGKEFGWARPLSTGLFLEGKWDPRANVRRCCQLLTDLDQDPAQFHILLH